MVIGNKDAFLVKLLTSKGVPFLYVDESSKLPLNDVAVDDTLILFNNFDKLYKYKRLACRVIVWNILSKSILNWNRIGFARKIPCNRRIADYLTKQMILNLHAKNGFVCMDGSTAKDVNLYIKRETKFKLIPIPVDDSNMLYPKNNNNDHDTVISYIGRGDDIWKIKPLKKIIGDLSRIKNRRFSVHIYTNMKCNYVQELNKITSQNVSVFYFENYYGDKLYKSLNENSDIHISMGTSALNGALSGLPTVLIDASEYEFPENYKYKWLYQTQEYGLGRFIKTNERDFDGYTLEEIIGQCDSNHNKVEHVNKCVKYINENHSASKILSMFAGHNSYANMLDIAKYTPATWRITDIVRRIKNR